jgi:2-dehydro-3-deoxyphosphogluconate aldolase/(4S)-4-hydroxy-2-oxoglutarate aldolase
VNIDRFKQFPIMGILRGVEPDIIEPLTDTVISSGLQTIEIAMNTPAATELIRQMVKSADGTLTVGAGTVLTTDDLHQALDAGATFIVLPVLVPDIVEYCAKNSIPVFPGALTPFEIFNAWQAGATMVKVFPASFFGPEYFKEIKRPFGDIELLACGGVKPDNVREFFSCGASAVAFGGSIFKHEWLQKRDFISIENGIKNLIKKGGMK